MLHLKRIEEHELRSLAITRQRLQIERDREARGTRKAGIERSRGQVAGPPETLGGPQDDSARVAATRQWEKDLKAYREKTRSLIEESEAAAAGANTAAALDFRETMFQRRKFRAGSLYASFERCSLKPNSDARRRTASFCRDAAARGSARRTRKEIKYESRWAIEQGERS